MRMDPRSYGRPKWFHPWIPFGVALPKSWATAKPRDTSLNIQRYNLNPHLLSFELCFSLLNTTQIWSSIHPSPHLLLASEVKLVKTSQSRCCAAAKESPVRSMVGGTPFAWPRQEMEFVRDSSWDNQWIIDQRCHPWLIESRYLGICAWGMDVRTVYLLPILLFTSFQQVPQPEKVELDAHKEWNWVLWDTWPPKMYRRHLMFHHSNLGGSFLTNRV